MRIVPLLTAVAVTGALYVLVFERDRLTAFASGEAGAVTAVAETPAPAEVPPPVIAQLAEGERIVSVLARHSMAQQVDSALLVRGQTEAARLVDVRAETSGLIVSEPLRRGAYVTKDQALCVLDTGTRQAQLKEAQARLMEAQSRLPEAEARLVEARARLAEAEINDRAAARLSQDGFASETRVAATVAAVESARAGVNSAQSGVQAATSGIRSAEAA
ncbi:MAG: efflux RND transporter periplasmic adaptor subunit, partial [Pseudorhodobacter sp.]|nr:efflux RND transporter periplasmic adaptor subunit [Pseudorhodobacter sp.]